MSARYSPGGGGGGKAYGQREQKIGKCKAEEKDTRKIIRKKEKQFILREERLERKLGRKICRALHRVGGNGEVRKKVNNMALYIYKKDVLFILFVVTFDNYFVDMKSIDVL